MKLYHCSKAKLSELTPTVGPTRHGGEDSRAVGKAVVWLSNDQSMSRADSNGDVDLYQHEVDIDPGDPDLLMDEAFDAMMKSADALFGKPSGTRWYFYSKPISVDVVRTWNQATGRYE